MVQLKNLGTKYKNRNGPDEHRIPGERQELHSARQTHSR